MLGGVSESLAGEASVGDQLHDLLSIKIGEPQAMCRVDDQVEHRPAQAQATGFSGETTNHLRPAPDFFKGSFQEVR